MRISLQDVFLVLLIVVSVCPMICADDGYDLWMSCQKLDDAKILEECRLAFSSIVIHGDSETLRIAREQARKGLGGLVGVDLPICSTPARSGALVIGTPKQSDLIQGLDLSRELATLGHEACLIRFVKTRGVPSIVITANEDVGLLYGSFHLLTEDDRSSDL